MEIEKVNTIVAEKNDLIVKLQSENQSLTSRILSEKSKAVDDLNEMNDRTINAVLLWQEYYYYYLAI